MNIDGRSLPPYVVWQGWRGQGINARTFAAFQPKGRCISGMAISPLRIQDSNVWIELLFASYCAMVLLFLLEAPPMDNHNPFTISMNRSKEYAPE